MKFTLRLTLILGFLTLCAGFPAVVRASDSSRSQKDSLRQVVSRTDGPDKIGAYKELARLYRMESRKEGVLDTLLTIYDALAAEAQQTGDVAEQSAAGYNRLIALYDNWLFDEIIRQALAILAFQSENGLWKNYYQTYTMLLDAYRRKRDFDRALEEANRVYDDAKGRGDRAGMGVALHAVARIYTDQRRFPEAEKSLRESIEMMQDETAYLNTLASVYNHLVQNLIAQERYDEALAAARETEAVNRRFEAATKSPQISAWYNLYLTYADIYRQTGAFDKAQIYVDKIDSITKGSVRMYKERGHILYGKKRYREAVEMLDSAIAASPKTLEPKALKLMALTQLKDSEKAVELFSEVVGELQARHNTEYNAKLDEIRTQYEVDKYIAEKERNRNYFLFALGGCLLLGVLLGVMSYYNRVVTRKNLGLYNRIKEQDRLEEELVRLRAQTKGETEPETPLPGDRQQRELVGRLREYLLTGDNLSNADVGRDEITTALGTNKNTLTDAVRAVTGQTPMEYLRGMRLDEARRMLDSHPELTIEAVAFSCGFSIPSTFYRLFRRQWGISPAEYRKMAESQRA